MTCRTFWAWCACVFVSGCTSTPAPTRVMLLIDAEPEVRARTATLDVAVRGGTGAIEKWSAAKTQHFTPGSTRKQSWPLELALEPRAGDATRSYEVVATARDEDGASVISARAISGFRAHRTLSLLLRLDDTCLASPACTESETCRGGECVDPHVAIGDLPSYERDPHGEPVLKPFWEHADTKSGIEGGRDTGVGAGAADADIPLGSDAGEQRDGGTGAAPDPNAPVRPEESTPLPDPPMSDTCPGGQGWNTAAMHCYACQFSPRCDAAGETGHVLALRGQNGSGCICETEQDYFTLTDGTAVACDNDGDGWVVDDAQAALESDDPVLRENARCRVRRVARVVLRNERGESITAEDFSQQFGDASRGILRGLPLYESARNDGTGAEPPSYGHGVRARPFAPAELNSLTKACNEQQADFNDDGIADIEQFSGSAPKLKAARAALSAYYQKYVRFSYFLELHDGWYDDADGTPSYFVREKPRNLVAEHHVPVIYPSNLDADSKLVSNYAQSCPRHADGLYLGNAKDKTSAPAITLPNTIGGDFVEFTQAAAGEPDFHGMTHHAQYKCVLIVNEAEYDAWPDGAASEQSDPHLLFPSSTQGELVRKDSSGAAHTYRWTLEDCVLDASAASLPAQGPARNPSLVGLRCSPSSAAVLDAVAWAAVGYEDYATPYIDASQRGGYVRGCVNACLEPMHTDEAHDCKQCHPKELGSLGFVADASDLPEDDGNPCTTEQCQGTNPVHTATAAGASCGMSGVCDGQGQCSACLSGNHQCTLDGVNSQSCESGHWGTLTPCTGSVCSGAGVCGECMPNAKTCSSGTGFKTCDSTGHYSGAETACTGSVCSGAGSCGVCQPNDAQCAADGATIENCNSVGQWVSGVNCSYGCAFGACQSCPCCDGGCGGSCFVAGTQVTLADGSEKAIEQIEVGERVLGYDTATRRFLAARVLRRLVHPDTQALVVLNQTLITTPEHRFYVEGEWVHASDLAASALLSRFVPGSDALASEPLSGTESQLGPTTTYNLEVEDVHDYFAGGFLVHNFKN